MDRRSVGSIDRGMLQVFHVMGFIETTVIAPTCQVRDLLANFSTDFRKRCASWAPAAALSLVRRLWNGVGNMVLMAFPRIIVTFAVSGIRRCPTGVTVRYGFPSIATRFSGEAGMITLFQTLNAT